MRGRSFTCDFPFIWEEFCKTLDGMSRYPINDIAQIGEWVDADPFACGDEAGQDGGGPAAGVTSEEHLVFYSYRDHTK